MTKVDIFSGFLGAGKTTLIKKLLSDGYDKNKIVIIENEFGEIGIDGGFLKETGIQTREMNSGCICCSLVGDFGKALKEVQNTYNPDRIIIEPSGVGKLSDVVTAVEKAKEECDLEINSLVDVVNAENFDMYFENFSEFFVNQIENAGTIILSRVQLIEQAEADSCIAKIKETNPNAFIIATPWDELTGKQILAAMDEHSSAVAALIKESEEEAHHDHEHHHDHDECCEHDHEHHHDHEHDHEHEHHHHDHDECCEHDHEHHHHDHDKCCEHDHEHEHHHHDHDENCTCGCHDHDHEHHHHADEVFTSWGKETVRKYSKEELEAILKALADKDSTEYGTILRAKGILQCSSGKWLYYDLTPGAFDIRDGQPACIGSLCVIGVKLDKEKLAKLFML